MMRTFWIDVGYACYGIQAKDGTIVVAAPIAGWMIGKMLGDIKPFLVEKKAKVIELA